MRRSSALCCQVYLSVGGSALQDYILVDICSYACTIQQLEQHNDFISLFPEKCSRVAEALVNILRSDMQIKASPDSNSISTLVVSVWRKLNKRSSYIEYWDLAS